MSTRPTPVGQALPSLMVELISQELTDTKHQLESEVRDLRAKLTSAETDNERLRSDFQTIRQDYTSLGSDRTEQEREMTHLRMKLAVTEQDLKMKDEQLMRISDELSFERDAKVCLSVCLSD